MFSDDETLEKFTKALVVNCVRNTFLEDIHSGKSKLGNAEMKCLMQEIVNKVYTFLKFSQNPKFMQLMMLMSEGPLKDWDKPKLDKDFLTVEEQSKKH